MPHSTSRRARPFGWLLILAGFLAASLARAAAPIPGYVVLPLESMGGSNHAGLRVTINGHPTALVVDTGASRTTLDRRVYREATASLTPAQRALPPGIPATGKANGVPVEVGEIQNLTAGPMQFGSGPVAVLDLSALHGRNGSDAAGGLLGEDILNRYAAIIDWPRHGIYLNTILAKRMHLGPALVASGWTAVPMTRTRVGHFTVPATIEGRSFRLTVDTGATFMIVDIDQLHSGEVIYRQGLLAMRMIGFDARAWPAKLTEWKVGNYHVASFTGAAQKLPLEFMRADDAPDSPCLGLLGSDFLAKNSAIIDISGSTLYLKSGSSH